MNKNTFHESESAELAL